MSEQSLTLARLNTIRAKLKRLNDGKQIHNDAEACRFINERGFVLLMPVEGIPFPSLSEADAAEPWQGLAITDRAWAWKETLPEQKLCAYTKLIHGRGTFISWGLYPSFLRVYGPEGDLDYEYENGRLERAARDLCKIVADFGPINSRNLWIKSKDIFGGKRTRFIAALEHLQSKFLLTVAGGSLEGWTLHIWDLVERQVPKDILAKLPALEEARANILYQAVQNCVAIPASRLRSILRLSPADFERSVAALKRKGAITEITVKGQKLPWLTTVTVKDY